jgi:hypothetical protein
LEEGKSFAFTLADVDEDSLFEESFFDLVFFPLPLDNCRLTDFAD